MGKPILREVIQPFSSDLFARHTCGEFTPADEAASEEILFQDILQHQPGLGNVPYLTVDPRHIVRESGEKSFA